MNKKLVGIALIVSLAVVGGFVYLLTGTKTPTEHMPNTSSATGSTPAITTPGPSPSPGTYTAYSAEAVASDKGTKILFFHAPWCTQCQKLEASINAGPIPDGVTIYKVDYDSATALKQKYEVVIQTTLVSIDDSGNLIKKFVAYDNPTLATLVEKLL